MRVTLAKAPNNGGYGARTAHFLQLDKTSAGGIGIPTQPQALRPTICPAYKMCWAKCGEEIMRVDNQ